MKLADIKPNTIEAIICFVMYICAQDKIISEEEYTSLGKKIADVIDNDVSVKKISRTDMRNQISVINKLILKSKFNNKKIDVIEQGFFKSLLTHDEFIDLGLRTARIVASADGFHRDEKAKFDKWIDLYLNE